MINMKDKNLQLYEGFVHHFGERWTYPLFTACKEIFISDEVSKFVIFLNDINLIESDG